MPGGLRYQQLPLRVQRSGLEVAQQIMKVVAAAKAKWTWFFELNQAGCT